MKLHISSIQPFLCLDGIDLVTDARRARINTYVQTADQARCLVAGLLLRKVCGVTADSQLRLGEQGKPYLKNSGSFFNISHSGDYVVLATADSEIGVDIEKIAPADDAVAARCFTAEEQEWIQCKKNDEAFFTLWTAKESVMKGTGLGLSLLPETFCVLPIDASPHYIAGRVWFLNWLVYNGHVICTATQGKAEKMESLIVSPDELRLSPENNVPSFPRKRESRRTV